MIEARRQRDRAEFQARRAQASSEFMRYLVTQIGNKPMTMREVLDRGRIALEQQYQGDPAFVARMLVQLSGPYIELGDYKTSAQMMARALQIASTLDDPDLLAATHCETAFDLARGKGLRGRAPTPRRRRQVCAARVLARAERGMCERRDHDSRWPSADSTMPCSTRPGRWACSNRRESRPRPGTRARSTIWPAAYSGAGRLPEALATQRRVTEASRRIGRGETIGVVVSLQDEGAQLRRLGRWIEADRRFRGSGRAGQRRRSLGTRAGLSASEPRSFARGTRSRR